MTSINYSNYSVPRNSLQTPASLPRSRRLHKLHRFRARRGWRRPQQSLRAMACRRGGSLETQLAGWEIHRLYVYTVYVYVYIYIIRPAPHGLILSLDVFRCKTPCGNKTNAIALTSRREKTISEA